MDQLAIAGIELHEAHVCPVVKYIQVVLQGYYFVIAFDMRQQVTIVCK